MSQSEKQRFENILNVLTTRLKIVLYQISDKDLSELQEIRLRSEKPVVIVKNGGSYFLNDKCVLTKLYSSDSVIITAQEVADIADRYLRGTLAQCLFPEAVCFGKERKAIVAVLRNGTILLH